MASRSAGRDSKGRIKKGWRLSKGGRLVRTSGATRRRRRRRRC